MTRVYVWMYVHVNVSQNIVEHCTWILACSGHAAFSYALLLSNTTFSKGNILTQSPAVEEELNKYATCKYILTAPLFCRVDCHPNMTRLVFLVIRSMHPTSSTLQHFKYERHEVKACTEPLTCDNVNDLFFNSIDDEERYKFFRGKKMQRAMDQRSPSLIGEVEELHQKYWSTMVHHNTRTEYL